MRFLPAEMRNKLQMRMEQKDYLMAFGFMISIITILTLARTGTITGFAAMNTGCCEMICQETSQALCDGPFQLGKTCSKIQECNVGCCIDNEGYCLSNYLKGNCENKGYDFIATSECIQYPKCIISPPPDSVVGYTGYQNVFGSAYRGVAFVEPFSNTKGNPFTVRFYSFDNTSRDIRVKAFTPASQKVFSLYDDGSHDDGNSGDGLYGGIFDSATFPITDDIVAVNFTTIIDGNQSDYYDYFIITSTTCLPIRKPWELSEQRKNVIFVDIARDANEENLFLVQAQNAIGSMLAVDSFSKQASDINFYIIKEVLDPSRLTNAKDKVSDQCFFYDANRDIIILFDNSYDYCEKEDNLIRTNPNLIINTTALSNISDTNEFFNKFCSNTLTQKQIEEKILSLITTPNVTIISPLNNTVFGESLINLSFNITEINEPLEYEIYLDADSPAMLLDKGTVLKNKSTEITLPDGLHKVWVEVEGLNNRIGYSDTINILVNVSNFIIDITSLSDVYYELSPDINFTISNAFETQIIYEVFADSSLYTNGTTSRTALNTVHTNFTAGIHSVQIKAKDEFNHTTYSAPYELSVTVE